MGACQGLLVFAMTRDRKSPSLAGYVTIGDAAEMLGVSVSTLRNWDRRGKLKPRRHPINGYRLYSTTELKKLLDDLHDEETE
ncbi:MAG: MerR family DNA-binding transcriptional regulator [Planctomycetota bacterium]